MPNKAFHMNYDHKHRESTQSHSADFVQFNICLKRVVLWILVQTILKNIELSIFYECFTTSSKAYILTNGVLTVQYLKNSSIDWAEIFCEHISLRVLLAIEFSIQNIELLRFYESSNMNKNLHFQLFWYFITYDWNKIAIWNFYWS